MIFFADENVPISATRLLEAYDRSHEVRHLTDEMAKGTPDEHWSPEISARNPRPIVLCGDGRILRNKVQQSILRSSGLTFVYFSGGWMNLPWHEFAWKLVKIWPDIVRNAENARGPTVFEVKPTSTKVRRVTATAEL